MDKFAKLCNTEEKMEDKISVAMDSWLAFLTEKNLLAKMDLESLENGEHLKDAIGEANSMVLTKQERYAYDSHLKAIMDEEEAIRTIKSKMQKKIDAEKKAKEEAKKAEEKAKKAKEAERKAKEQALTDKKALKDEIAALRAQITKGENTKDEAMAVSTPKENKNPKAKD